MKLTPSQVRALEIVEKAGVVRPREFAKAMWPESEGWRRHSRCGPNGVHQGGGMYLAGGGYLGKLSQLGVIRQQFRGAIHSEDGYALTEEGKVALRKAQDNKKTMVKG